MASQYKLSSRELEVLRLLVRGLRNKEIADILCVTEGTVEGHVSNICERLGVQSRGEAVYAATQHRLLIPDLENRSWFSTRFRDGDTWVTLWYVEGLGGGKEVMRRGKAVPQETERYSGDGPPDVITELGYRATQNNQWVFLNNQWVLLQEVDGNWREITRRENNDG